MDMRFLERDVNNGFSGGEKKRNEILQMAVLEVIRSDLMCFIFAVSAIWITGTSTASS